MKNIIRFFRQFSELPLLVIAVVVFYKMPEWYEIIDENAAAFDSGFLHRFAYTAIGTFAAFFTTWVMLKLAFPKILHYFYSALEDELITLSGENSDSLKFLSKCVKLIFCLCFLALHLWVFLTVLQTIQ